MRPGTAHERLHDPRDHPARLADRLHRKPRVKTTYRGKAMNLAFEADQGSREVKAEIDGHPTTLSEDSALRALKILREAIKYARA